MRCPKCDSKFDKLEWRMLYEVATARVSVGMISKNAAAGLALILLCPKCEVFLGCIPDSGYQVSK